MYSLPFWYFGTFLFHVALAVFLSGLSFAYFDFHFCTLIFVSCFVSFVFNKEREKAHKLWCVWRWAGPERNQGRGSINKIYCMKSILQ